MTEEKIYRIAQFGTFDLKNYGDILFPDVLAHRLGQHLPLELVLFSPIGGTKPFDGQRVYPIQQLAALHEEKPFDAIIIGGGDLLRLDTNLVTNLSKYDCASSLDLWAYPIVFGAQHNIPVLFNAPGVPFALDADTQKALLPLLAQVDYLSLRDAGSKTRLYGEAACEAVVVPDTVFSVLSVYSKEHLAALRQEMDFLPDSPYFVFQCNSLRAGLSPADYIQALKDFSAAQNVTCLLMPIGYVHQDVETLTALNEAAGNPFPMVEGELSPAQQLAVIDGALAFVGSSFHGCLTALVCGNAAVGVDAGGLHKLAGLFQYTHQPDCLIPSIAQLSTVNPRPLEEALRTALISQVEEHFRTMADIIRQGGQPKDCTQLLYHLLTQSLPAAAPKATLYWGQQQSFSEAASMPFHHEGQRVSFTYQITEPVDSLRLDPIEQCCMVHDLTLTVNGENIAPQRLHLNGILRNGVVLFPDPDPQILLTLPTAQPVTVTASFGVVPMGQAEDVLDRLCVALREETPAPAKPRCNLHGRVLGKLKRMVGK